MLKNSKRTSKCQSILCYSTRKKVSQCQKKCNGGPFGIFQHPFCSKTQKKIEGDTLGKNFPQKSLARSKKLIGGTLWSRTVLHVTRESFLVQFPGPTGAISNFVELLVELLWSLQVYQKNTDEKP